MKRALSIVLLSGLLLTMARSGQAQPFGGMQPPCGPQPPMSPPAFGPQPPYGPQAPYPPQLPYGPAPFGQPPFRPQPLCCMQPPPYGMPPNWMPPNGMPPNGMPPNWMPPNGMPPNGMPPNGMPPNGMPPNGMPPNGMPPPPFGMPGAQPGLSGPYSGSPGAGRGLPPSSGLGESGPAQSSGPLTGPTSTESKDAVVPPLPPPFGAPGGQEPPLSGEGPSVPFSPGRTLNPGPAGPGPAANPPSVNPLLNTPAAPPGSVPWQYSSAPELGSSYPLPAYQVTEEPHDWYPKGDWTFQALVGYYTNASSPSYSYAPIDLRIGKILDYGCQEGILRGYFEPILEIQGAPTFGIGHAFVGANALLRYNFVQPPVVCANGCERCRLVPYIQVGVGLQYNDGYQDTTQTALGQALEYTFEAQVGVHYFLTHCLSLDVEAGFQMITNLGQSSNNGGIYAVGGSIGFTYYFPGYVCHR